MFKFFQYLLDGAYGDNEDQKKLMKFAAGLAFFGALYTIFSMLVYGY